MDRISMNLATNNNVQAFNSVLKTSVKDQQTQQVNLLPQKQDGQLSLKDMKNAIYASAAVTKKGKGQPKLTYDKVRDLFDSGVLDPRVVGDKNIKINKNEQVSIYVQKTPFGDQIVFEYIKNKNGNIEVKHESFSANMYDANVRLYNERKQKPAA